MLVPDPKVVRKLLTRYASLRIAQAEQSTPALTRELEDVSYTLCVMTATMDIGEAIARADALLVARGSQTATDTEGDSGLPLAV